MDYNAKIEEKARQSRELEDRRDALNGEFRSLNIQSESRAKLSLKQSEIKSRTQDIQTMWVITLFRLSLPLQDIQNASPKQ